MEKYSTFTSWLFLIGIEDRLNFILKSNLLQHTSEVIITYTPNKSSPIRRGLTHPLGHPKGVEGGSSWNLRVNGHLNQLIIH